MAAEVYQAEDACAMRDVGRRLAQTFRAGDVVILSGALGAGKTTLTQGIAEGLEVQGPVTSPTFVISRLHESKVGGPDLMHVDAYRLSSLAEFEDLDLEGELHECVTVVEWGQGMAEVLSGTQITVAIDRETAPRSVVVARTS